ncbi:MAG: ferrous iron transport protein B [Myxococcaceae bacterium]
MKILLIGNPNAGKSSLFEALTGTCVKVANHAGVTVEQQSACCCLSSGESIEFVDLPGLYSLSAYSDEEKVTLDLLDSGSLLFVLDATHLKRNLFLLTELLDAGYHPRVALNQIDLAKKLGLEINLKLLGERLGLDVFPVSARTGEGLKELKLALLTSALTSLHPAERGIKPSQRYEKIDAILEGVITQKPVTKFNPDDILLHPVAGLVALAAIFGVLFLTLFAIGKPLADLLETGFEHIGQKILPALSDYPLFGSLLVEGIIAGVGTLLAFVPLIALLFFLLGLLEESGYLARATFLLDRLLSKAGLSGRAFVPLLSGFACAIPAILSTRVIRSKQSRLIAMLVIPFLSCSARLPLYALLIAAFFPAWQGALVMISLYTLGVLAAFLGGYCLKRFYLKTQTDELILEMPRYRSPRIGPIFKIVKERTGAFLRQAGTLILSMSILMWALFHFPQGAPIQETLAGRLGHFIEPAIAPLGFDWKIGLGLLAAFSAREVMVSTLGVIYGMDSNWALAYSPLVAVSLLVFFALAMQCISTLVIMRQETQTWRWPLFQFVAMTSIAWISSFMVYQVGSVLGY